jgi:hypothetical protein
MHIEKDAIVRHLHRHGRHDDAVRADSELPDRVHSVQDAELLQQWGIDPEGIDEILREEQLRED